MQKNTCHKSILQNLEAQRFKQQLEDILGQVPTMQDTESDC